MSTSSRVLVYYFGFPHYRRAILLELMRIVEHDLEIVSGTSGRGSVATLSDAELPGLRLVPTIRIGPFTWDRAVANRAISAQSRAVVVGPATTSITTWVILLSRRIAGRRTFLWGQCGRPGDRSPKRWVQELMNRLASGLLVYGEAEAASAQELGTPGRKVHIVRNATESNKAATTPAAQEVVRQRFIDATQSAISRRAIRLLYVGRLVPFKRIDPLLDAARILATKYSVEVDIVGGGDDAERLAAEYADPNVRFHGWVYAGPERDALFARATLVVSPWHLGLLAIDALRAGVPVLVPDNPMNASEVESLTMGTNAVQFRAGDARALAAGVEEWLSIAPSIDPEGFIAARAEALRHWAPERVAAEIARVVGAAF